MTQRRRRVLIWLIGVAILAALAWLPGREGVAQAAVLPWFGQVGDRPPPADETTGEPSAIAATPPPGQHPYQQQIVALVNGWRAQYGLRRLRVDPRLARAAADHNAAMLAADTLTHQAPGELPLCALEGYDRYTAALYPWAMCRENIATGQTTPDEVIGQWLASEGHCLNILAPDVTDIGVAYALDAGGRPWWTENFGAQLDEGDLTAPPTPVSQPGPCPIRLTPTPPPPTTTPAPSATPTPLPSATPTPVPAPLLDVWLGWPWP